MRGSNLLSKALTRCCRSFGSVRRPALGRHRPTFGLATFARRSNVTSAASSGGDFETDESSLGSLTHAIAPLNNVAVLQISGRDAAKWLQSLTTNDIDKLAIGSAHYSFLLNAKGRFLFDAMVWRQSDDSFLCEFERDFLDDVRMHLDLHKARSKVRVDDLSESTRVWSAMCGPMHYSALLRRIDKLRHSAVGCLTDADNGGSAVLAAYSDPRFHAMGARLILGADSVPPLGDEFAAVGSDVFDLLRMCYGLPSARRCFGDLMRNKSIILECGAPQIDAISFEKGCYIGQELMARSWHRGQVRKRLYPCVIHRVEADESSQALVNKMERTLVHDSASVLPRNVLPFMDGSVPRIEMAEYSCLRGDLHLGKTEEWDDCESVYVRNSRTLAHAGKVVSKLKNVAIVQLRDEVWKHWGKALYQLTVASDKGEALAIRPYAPKWVLPAVEHLFAP